MLLRVHLVVLLFEEVVEAQAIQDLPGPSRTFQGPCPNPQICSLELPGPSRDPVQILKFAVWSFEDLPGTLSES